MKKLIVGVAAALSLMTSNAAADGIDRGPPPSIAAPVYEPPLVPTWSGFYIGAGVGAGAVVHDISIFDDFFDPPERLARLDGIGGEGAFGTVIVGWDWQVGATTVLGVFADYDFSDISTTASAFDDTFRASLDHDNSWSVGGRLGWLSSPATLWYLTAGYTEAEFEVSARSNGFRVDLDDLPTLAGYFVGAGVDTRLVNNWFLRLEYRFTEFDTETFDFPEELLSVDVEPSMHTARLTLTYKFGGGGGYGWSWWGQ